MRVSVPCRARPARGPSRLQGATLANVPSIANIAETDHRHDQAIRLAERSARSPGRCSRYRGMVHHPDRILWTLHWVPGFLLALPLAAVWILRAALSGDAPDQES